MIQLLLFLLSGMAGGDEAPRLVHHSDRVELVNLSPTLLEQISRMDEDLRQKLLSIYLAPAPKPDEKRPSILGTTGVEGNKLVFRPNFPFYPGHDHTALFNSDLIARWGAVNVQPLTFKIPKPELPSIARVVDISPNMETVPSNLLRLYVTFSHTMRRGNAQAAVRLLDENGEPVRAPFLNVKPELWDPESKRLTLLFDPGRIKRGLVPHKQMGPPLLPNRTYTLEIDRSLTDARGAPLAATFRKTFRTGPTDRKSPNWKAWTPTIPGQDTRNPLHLTFDEPLDQALALRMIQIEDPNGNPKPCAKSLSKDGKTLSFSPDHPWQPGAYRIHIDPAIEDPAGNQLHKLFDVDMQAQDQSEADPEPPVIHFHIKQTS
ncbi:MAG: Ig-like domain-containing protein [Acidobacteriota bacterium]|nr:Ig-like domain-containing protein [Acidobacteriota bacterium]